MSDEIPGFGQQSGPDFKRILITTVLMSALFIGFNHFFAAAPKQAEEPKTQTAPEAQVVSPALPAPTVEPAAEADPTVVASPDNLPLQKTDFRVGVENKVISDDPAWPHGGYELSTVSSGAKIASLGIYGYRDTIALMSGAEPALFGLRSRPNSVVVKEDAPYEIIQSGPREIVYQRTTPEGLRIRRLYSFSQDNYMLHHELVVENISQLSKHVELDLTFKTAGKAESGSFLAPAQNELNFIAHQKDDLARHSHDEILKTVSVSGPADFVGFEERYFLLSVLPKDPNDLEKVLVSGAYANAEKYNFDASMTVSLKAKDLAPAGMAKWEFDSYVGPKQLSLLKEVGRGLDETVNFGWFGVISRPLLWLLVQIYGFVHNFGLAIILLTLLIKLLTFPLTQKSFVSMQEMKKISPEIKALEKKYGHDRTTLSQKQMELYRERGVNPMAGCLPMLLQFPIWIALYQMLSNSIEIYQKPFMGWLTDLTAPDPFYVLPILMGISMVIQQILQPVQDDQKAMKYAMLATSVFFTYIMLNLPSGLSLYMFVNNVLTLIQQLVIKRRFDVRTA